MKTIIITPETDVESEIETCNQLLNSGIHRLHLRKPFATEEIMRNYISQLDTHFLHKVSLHSHHQLVDEFGLGGKHYKSDRMVDEDHSASKSFHDWQAIANEKTALSYGFLSPLFDCLSKPGYRPAFDQSQLRVWLRSFSGFPVFALGGIDIDKIAHIKALGFNGVAMIGAIWSMPTIEERLQKTEIFINA